ncbi:plant/protein [Thalictrum thalictroides]|uniref:Plant/protein n=1 Tax=Thalictrum thalictroides TaxID=46969 RepID=A0A7J6WSW6_THATH|nr:plant/protein [Thalictrum thalictroides]
MSRRWLSIIPSVVCVLNIYNSGNNHHLNTTSSLNSFPIQPFSLESSRKRWGGDTTCGFSGRSGGGVGGGGDGETAEERENDDGRKEEEDLERAIHLDGSIPGSSDEFVKRVSSRAYDMRRHVQQSLDSTSYDVLEANPWRESSKPVYVLTQKENQLCTMKTRRNRSEVERELGQLFSKGAKRKPEFGNKTKQSRNGRQFRMLVEDVREGILVFEDQNDAARYCDLLQGGGQGCEGVAEIDSSSVFDICQKMRALAVLFRRGGTPPLPESLQLYLKAKKRSLEDQDEV